VSARPRGKRQTRGVPVAPERGDAPPGLSIRHPALWIAALAAAVCVAVSTGFGLWETDFWQHLLVGKAIWSLGHVPTTQLWSWPTYGAPDVNPSWGFSALLWPVWNAGGLTGLFLWRWATSLAAFALLWLAARRMGARGFTPFVVIALAALTWRYRSQVRPETLEAVLIALQIWILETRRSGGPDRSLWLIPLQWVWANTHLSSHLGLAMIGFHVLHDLLARRGHPPYTPAPGRLALIGLAALLVSFANPYGWRALWQPFEYFLFWRHETIYRAIAELQPLFPFAWQGKIWTGLPLLLVAWPVLALVHARRRGLDVVEWLALGVYTAITLSTMRFAGFYAIVAVPFVARDLAPLLSRAPRPAPLRSPYAAAALTAALAVGISLPEWSRETRPFGPGIDERRMPVAACDFIETEGLRGRMFNPFYFGGYLLWRFWPEKERLPFMDIHQSGTRDEQRAYVRMFTDPDGWRALDARYAFEVVVLDAAQHALAMDASRDRLDADPRFALVFRDDAAAVYVRKDGRHAALAAARGQRFVPGGDALLPRLGRMAETDTVFRASARAELERRIASSRWNAEARSMMANLDFLDRDLAAAKHQLEAALAVDPALFGAHERLALIAMQENRPADAVRELEAELKIGRGSPLLAIRLADAYRQTGQVEKSRTWYGRAGVTSPPPGGSGADTSGR
jgi:hypothetical protein